MRRSIPALSVAARAGLAVPSAPPRHDGRSRSRLCLGGGVPAAVGATFASSMKDMLDFGSLPRMASGGVVRRPTIAMIGESGAEAIIPLSQMNGMGGNINITVNAGMGVNGAELGQQIIDEIRKSERRSGRVFAAA